MKILFVHFPIDSDQIGGRELPNFFAEKGHDVYALFRKGSRSFTVKHEGGLRFTDVSEETIKKTNFDIVLTKSDSYQKYGKKFLAGNPLIINLMPMGIKSNLVGVDYYFAENEIIKAPVKKMQDVLINYTDYDNRNDQIIIPASIGTDKNQLEFLNFYDPDLFPGYRLVFAGPVHNFDYVNSMIKIMRKKSIDYEFLGYLDRKDLAEQMSSSKLAALTTDPRPAQPFDPGPRVIYELALAGTPCFISDLVLVHRPIEKYCFTYCNKDSKSFNSVIKTMAESDLSLISKKIHQYAKDNYTIENACLDSYDKIIHWYCLHYGKHEV